MRILLKGYLFGVVTGMLAAIAFLAGLLHYQRKQAQKAHAIEFFGCVNNQEPGQDD